MLRLKRLSELFALFFQMIREDGLGYTLGRATAFLKRRLRSKKGRFLPGKEELARERETDCSAFPKLSICTALYNTDPKFLREFVESFLHQTNQNSELCLADASDDAHEAVGQYIAEIMQKTDRVKYVKLEDNGGISVNTNAAAQLATGSYLALADHDDILAPNACYVTAKAAAETGADFLYSDEALFTTDYLRPLTGHFKPEFAPHYLTGCNYICHLAAFKKELFFEAGGLDAAYDGSQDHDLFFRLTERAEKIVHLPKVLYYWRVHAGSTSGGVEAKPYVEEAAMKAIDAHLARTGVKGHAVKGKFPSTYKVEYELPQPAPLVSILIPNKDHTDDLEKCLAALYSKTTYPNFEVLVIENNSTESETEAYYESAPARYKNLKVLRYQGGFNFSAINNFGRAAAKGEYLVLLNNDVEVLTPNWIEEMLGLCSQPETGAVGAMLYYPDDTIQHAGVITGLGGFAGHSHKYAARGHSGYMFRLATVQDFSCCTAAMLMVKASVYDEVGGLDEEFKVAFNDVDFCLAIRKAGYSVVFTPYAEAYHYESKSRGLDKKGEAKERFDGERARLKERWGDALLHDPFYNPNLTLDMENFSEAAVLPKD